MDCLQAKLKTGELDEIQIFDHLTICHRLFVDDVGVFIPAMEDKFNKLQTILKLYETTSRAKLNLTKSVIVPLTLPMMPQWLINTDYIISAPGVVQKYLGASFGQNLKSSQLHEFCLDQISKRIRGWPTNSSLL